MISSSLWRRMFGFRRPRRNGVLLTWWGAWGDRGWATIGDYMAVDNLARRLVNDGLVVDIASTTFSFSSAPTVDWQRVHRANYDRIVFVCGPIPWKRRLERMLNRFRGCRRIAVGVSVLEESPRGAGLFDTIVARDGTPDATFDLALASDWPEVKNLAPTKVTLCYCGNQPEYGDACQSERAESMLTAAAQALGEETWSLSTILGPDNSVLDIERALAGTRLMLTTRLHGSLFALRYGIPFVAVDQIVGGRKVASVLRRLGWPYVFTVDQLGPDTIANAISELNTPDGKRLLDATRRQAKILADEALEKSIAAVKSS